MTTTTTSTRSKLAPYAVLAVCVALLVGGLAWWFAPLPTRAPATADAQALADADPVQPSRFASDTELAPSDLDPIAWSGPLTRGALTDGTAARWEAIRSQERALLTMLPREQVSVPLPATARQDVETLINDLDVLLARFDLTCALLYRATIDDAWPVYVTAQIQPILAERIQDRALSGRTDELTASHLETLEVVAREQRRRGWRAQARLDAIRTSLRADLDAATLAFESERDAFLATRLAAINASLTSTVSATLPALAPLLPEATGSAPGLLNNRFAALQQQHDATLAALPNQELHVTDPDIAAADTALWERLADLRTRRIAAILASDDLALGDGSDQTDAALDALYPFDEEATR